MEFLRNRGDFVEPMTVDEAIKELESESLIKSVKKVFRGILIKTKEISPKDNPEYKGTFTIRIGNAGGINIKRDQGVVYDENGDYIGMCPHISSDGRTICWGNVEGLVWQLKQNRDIYWLAKISIDLLKNVYDEYDFPRNN